MLYLMEMGGLVMWPLLLTSFVATAVVVERLIFIFREREKNRDDVVEKILHHAQDNQIDLALQTGRQSNDFVARTLVHGLEHHDDSFSSALLQQASRELKRLSKGLPTLDTIITLAPLLGLFGTVTGLIRSFQFLGGGEISAPTAITGGIAEALIATAFGLIIAIVALIPYNYLNARVEEARHEIEDASTHLEMILMKLKERK